MKKYVISALAVLSASLLTSCNDMKDNASEPPSIDSAYVPVDFVAMNEATYSIMTVLGSGDESGILNNPFYWWSIMSDDCYGSGGLQDHIAKSLHHFTVASANQYEYDFILLYSGIARANSQIEVICNMDWTDAQKKQRNQLLGEGFFMRGLYNMWFSQLYGDVPLITSTEITDDMYEQQSAADVIYPQIIADFVSGVNLMSTDAPQGDGHANKYVAEAFLARAYMFWAGFYKKAGELAAGSAPAISLVDRNGETIQQEGCSVSSVSQADVIAALKDIVASGRYRLLKDFRSLWQYSNSLLWDEAHDGIGHAYEFIADMDRSDCFDMPGNGNGNDEELFQIQFMNASKWNPRMYSNNLSCFWGLRDGASLGNGKREFTYPFNQGLGQGTPSCNIWDDWTNAERNGNYIDLRKKASLIDLESELAQYTYEKDDCEESGYAVKKYANVNLDACAADNDTWWSMTEGYTSNSYDNKMQGDHFEDFYLMRYADVLLMLTELTGDASYMNQVQARAGVPQTPYSLTALQNERRWEFAFEGLRFNDLRRWSGIDSGEGSMAAKALQAQRGKQIVCLGNKANKRILEHMTNSWSKRYADTNGFLPKPQSQINLMNDKMVQNPGWDSYNQEVQYKVLY
jgi:hypothetical protein